MKMTTKGIGWLIFGTIVCLSMTEADGVRGALSSVFLGAVFVSIYFIKQRFDPKGIGWYIASGVFLAFLVEADSASNLIIALVIAVACMMEFLRRNRKEVQDVINDADEGISEYSPDWMNEGSAEVPEEETVVSVSPEVEAAAEEASKQGSSEEVEFEIDIKE